MEATDGSGNPAQHGTGAGWNGSLGGLFTLFTCMAL